MYDGKISKERYNNLSNEGRKILVREYFLNDYSKVYSLEANGGSVAKHFINKAKQSEK